MQLKEEIPALFISEHKSFSKALLTISFYQFRVTIQSKSKYQLRLVKANQMTGKRPVQHQDQNLSDVYWRNEIYSVAFVLIFAWATCTFEKRATCHLQGCKTEVSFSLDPWACFNVPEIKLWYGFNCLMCIGPFVRNRNYIWLPSKIITAPN